MMGVTKKGSVHVRIYYRHQRAAEKSCINTLTRFPNEPCTAATAKALVFAIAYGAMVVRKRQMTPGNANTTPIRGGTNKLDQALKSFGMGDCIFVDN